MCRFGMKKTSAPGRKRRLIKHTVREFINKFKTLQGNPHYIAMGMAIGVFVSITPTIPLHTTLAIALALILRGSKSAAAIGVWFCNPLTVPFFYYACYKAGELFFGISSPFDMKYNSIHELLNLGMEVTCAMLAGGVVLGIIPAIAAYFITHRAVSKIRASGK